MGTQFHNILNSSTPVHHTFLNGTIIDFDNEEQTGFLTDEFMEYSTKIIYVSMCGIIASFGIAFNVINIIVFIKQGFADSVNISLFALAVSDLCIVCTALIQSLCYNLWINQIVGHINFRHVQYVSGAWPRGIFNRISSFITAYISFERCLCIMLPLKVKAILTRRVTLTVIALINLTVLSGLILVYTAIKLDPVFFETINRTVISLVFINGQYSADVENDYILVLSIYQVIAFILIWVFTLTLVYKMKSKNKWRESTLTSSQAESMSTRDKKVIKMVLLITVTFIICNTPTTTQLTAMYSLSIYNVHSVYRNLYIFAWSVCVFFETICASVNIFFYYRMSSKFAAVLETVMPAKFEPMLKKFKGGEEKKKEKKKKTGD